MRVDSQLCSQLLKRERLLRKISSLETSVHCHRILTEGHLYNGACTRTNQLKQINVVSSLISALREACLILCMYGDTIRFE